MPDAPLKVAPWTYPYTEALKSGAITVPSAPLAFEAVKPHIAAGVKIAHPHVGAGIAAEVVEQGFNILSTTPTRSYAALETVRSLGCVPS